MPSLIPFHIAANKGQLTGIALFSKHVDARVLAAGVNETVTKPVGARIVIFSADGDFFVDFQSATAAVPAADVTDGSASVLNPGARVLDGSVVTFGIISAANRIVTMEFYA